jgi:hypothetical protein
VSEHKDIAACDQDAFRSWRDVLPIHPAAELFPLMSKTELEVLAEDTKKSGLQIPITVLVGYLKGGGYSYQLLDGRSRLDALELAGFDLIGAPVRGKRGRKQTFDCGLDDSLGQESMLREYINYRIDIDDPYKYVISVNIHRRHLTRKKKREIIAGLIKADPTKSNREIGRMVKADNKTVASVRTEQERREEIPHEETHTDTKGRKQPARKPARKRPNPGGRNAAVTVYDPERGKTREEPATEKATTVPAGARAEVVVEDVFMAAVRAEVAACHFNTLVAEIGQERAEQILKVASYHRILKLQDEILALKNKIEGLKTDVKAATKIIEANFEEFLRVMSPALREKLVSKLMTPASTDETEARWP